MKIVVADTPKEVCTKLADSISAICNQLLQKQEFVTLCLSGGSTPKQLFHLLASEYQNKIDWKKMHIFWGDERCVAGTDERNNAKMARDALLNKLDVPLTQIHKIRTDIHPSQSAKEYQEVLKTYFDRKRKSFDLVLLGLGEDGHTLSIFPDSLPGIDQGNWVNVAYNKNDDLQRITLMPKLVNKSAYIIFLVTGTKKSRIVNEVITHSGGNKFPANLIRPANGELLWYLDLAAAGDLQK